MTTLSNIWGLVLLIVAVILNTLLALFVNRNNPSSRTNQIFGWLSSVMSIWLVCMYAAQQPIFEKQYLLLSRLTFVFATPMDVLFLIFAYTLPDRTFGVKVRTLLLLSLAAVVVMGLALSPYTFQRVESAAEPIPGAALPIVGGFNALLVMAAAAVLYRRSRRASGLVRAQFRFVGYGISLMFGLVILTIFLPVLLFHNALFVAFTPIYTLAFLGLTAYAIIVHRLLDIRALLARAVAFLLLIGLGAAAYAFVLFVGLQLLLGINIDTFVFIVAWLLTVVAILTFQPLFRLTRKLTNRVFFSEEYDSEQLLSELTRIMVESIDLAGLTQSILRKLTHDLKVQGAAFLIVDEHHRISRQERVGQLSDLTPSFLELERLFHQYLGNQDYFVFEDLPESELKELFRRLEISVAIPICMEKTEVAVLVLGAKLSGESYEQKDLNLLHIFASESGIAIQNAKAYEEIKKFNLELEQRVAARTRELKESQKEELAKAQEVSRLKDEFVFLAAHELRTPITAIRGFLELTAEARNRFPKDVEQNLSAISQASEHLNQLVSDLLEIARSNSGTLTVVTAPCPVTPIVKDLLNETASLVKEKKLKIATEISPKAQALCDPAKLKEVLFNLVGNAIKYNKEKGLIRINVYPYPGEKFLMFEVQDTGYGIPADQQAKIFQKFFRASAKGTEDILGTGLGLFICRMLVEKMGGKISFTSVEQQGTTFAFTLPLAPLTNANGTPNNGKNKKASASDRG